MRHQITIHTRFGGAISLEQQLIDLKRAVPVWLRPLYGLALRWLLPWLRNLQLKSTMIDVDHQAVVLADEQQAQDQRRALDVAAVALQKQHPDARVEIITFADGPAAIAIEHPPAEHDPAQQALGFGSLEIRSPWTVDPEP